MYTSRHARDRMRQRYGISLTPRQGRDLARAIAKAMDDGHPVAREPRRRNVYRIRFGIDTDRGVVEVPIVFKIIRGGEVAVTTVLPPHVPKVTP